MPPVFYMQQLYLLNKTGRNLREVVTQSFYRHVDPDHLPQVGFCQPLLIEKIPAVELLKALLSADFTDSHRFLALSDLRELTKLAPVKTAALYQADAEFIRRCQSPEFPKSQKSVKSVDKHVEDMHG